MAVATQSKSYNCFLPTPGLCHAYFIPPTQRLTYAEHHRCFLLPELLHERRRGATYSCVKLVLNKLSWVWKCPQTHLSQTPNISPRHTPPKEKPRSISNRPSSKLSHSPKRWSDLARIINFQSFVKMKFQNVKYMFPPITPCRQKLIIVLLVCPPRKSVLRAVNWQIQHNN